MILAVFVEIPIWSLLQACVLGCIVLTEDIIKTISACSSNAPVTIQLLLVSNGPHIPVSQQTGRKIKKMKMWQQTQSYCSTAFKISIIEEIWNWSWSLRHFERSMCDFFDWDASRSCKTSLLDQYPRLMLCNRYVLKYVWHSVGEKWDEKSTHDSQHRKPTLWY